MAAAQGSGPYQRMICFEKVRWVYLCALSFSLNVMIFLLFKFFYSAEIKEIARDSDFHHFTKIFIEFSSISPSESARKISLEASNASFEDYTERETFPFRSTTDIFIWNNSWHRSSFLSETFIVFYLFFLIYFFRFTETLIGIGRSEYSFPILVLLWE